MNARRRAMAILAAIGLAAMLTRAGGAQAPSREYAIKAECLARFAQFVEWPPQALPENRDTLVIGILGKNPFGTALDLIQGRVVRGRRLVVRQLSSVREATTCHILFVCASEKDDLRAILDAVRGASVLTVGETSGFAKSGGIINFTRSKTLGLQINPDAAERAHLRINSQLLRLAEIVRE